ncbi:Hypothetical predicted protein [Cloeon dipterum]|uniref:Uncharacterized protein n=1 Tax=Cloeon dipterum TaxID=197152 RepID=A0A8S1E244_9INSE|nr:Hypothetical predicted protein [Cloeon dipterum]
MDSFMGVRDTDRFIEKTTTDMTPLMLAARDENLESCLALLKSGESVKARTKFGVTPLHFAALNKENGIKIVWHLTNQEKLDVKEKDEDGEEAIFYAVRKGNFRVAQTLLELREKINNNLLHFFITQNRSDIAQVIHAWNPNLIKEVDSDRRNALHLAAQFADLSACKWLIAEGIDVASTSSFGTALHRAPLNKKHGIELVRFFVSKKLKLNEKSEFGFVPLDAALAAENIEIARELLTLGASLHIKDHNFLHYCVFLNKLKSAKFVHELDKKLIRGKDANERDAIHIAAEVADLEMCRWLVETGVPVDSLNGKRQTSVLHHVGYNFKHGIQLVRYFFHLGLDINEKDHFGFTPLSLRNFNFPEGELRKIGKMDLFMNVRDTFRFIEKTTEDLTLLMLAARDENLESCLYLLKKGESADAKTKFGVTPLHFAALNKENGIEIIRHLINQKKVDVKEKDVDGEEPIFYAIRKANFKVAQVLLELQGAETKNLLHFVITRNRGDAAPMVHAWNPDLIKQVDSDKRNALHLAAEYSDLNVCKWLIGEGIDVASKSVYGSALNRAALNKRHGEELVPFFYAQGLSLNETSEMGYSPLHAALAVENIEVAQEMISLGASLHKHNYLFYSVTVNKLNSAKFVNGLDNTQIVSRDKDGRTALHVAAEVADRVMCKWLIESGIPIYSTCSRWKSSALHHAVFNRRHGPSLVRFFHESGLNVNKKDNTMYTPIVHAVKAKNFEVAKELLSLGADLRWEKKGVNILHHCIVSNNLEGARFVHSKDPGLINELGKEGMNALHFAAAHADVKMCEWLYDQDVDVQAASEKQRNNVLHFVACNKEHGKSLVAFFDSKAVDVNKRNKSSLTPLHAALLNENIDVVGELLEVGADIFVKLQNDNILHFCILRDKFLSAKFVVRINRELLREETNGGMTALHLAARVADLDFCKFL